MLSGKLRETRWRAGDDGAALQMTSDRTLGRDEATYMHGQPCLILTSPAPSRR